MEISIPTGTKSASISLKEQWGKAFPSPAQATVSMNWSPTLFTLTFEVDEPVLRAQETNPWQVHQDSCVEFFFSLSGENTYYNLEANPLGCLLFASGEGREHRHDLSEEQGRLIQIEGSHVGREECPEDGSWWLRMGIPPQAVGLEHWEVSELRANIYKCGDALPQPHYLSWVPLSSANPDFHRPQDFATMRLSKEL
ncbi:MAG: hypothetical protein MI717_07220 [Spirochaetales bacterium]|nr:hypothetical protein [Spirochaetales bacterium]